MNLLFRPAAGAAFAAAILALFWLGITTSLRNKSLGFDEVLHATAGYGYWRFGDYGLQPENGNLPQRLAGLPLALGSSRPPATDTADWRDSEVPYLGYTWLYESGNDAARMTAAGHAACALLAVALGALVWAWSTQLFGRTGGFLSLTLYVLSPTILANGALITSDTAAALFLLAASGSWWAVLRRLSLGRLLGSALLVGALCVSKASAVLILPVMLLLGVCRIWEGSPLPSILGRWRGQIASRARLTGAIAAAGLVHALVAGVLIWSFYGFRYSAFPKNADGDRFVAPWAYVLGKPTPALGSQSVDFFRRHELLPEAWLYGMAFTLHQSESRRAFWNGSYSEKGWPGYFPYTFLVKTPLGEFAVCLLAAAAWIWGKSARRRLAYDTLPLWILTGVYWLAAIASHLNIGHRHLLPIYAPMFIFCGAAGAWLKREKVRLRPVGAVLCGILVILAAETVGWFPNYLAYFNGIVRPSEAYRHLVDSSLDWGQELPAAADYIRQHPDGRPYYLSYFGESSPAYYKVNARLLYSHGGPYLRGSSDLMMDKVSADQTDADVARLQRERGGYDLMGVGQSGDDVYAVFLRKAADLRMEAGTYLISATMLQAVYNDEAWGPWTPRYESIYRELSGQAQPLLSADPAVRQEAFRSRDIGDTVHLLDRYEEFRLARLTDYLRGRRPDDTINYGILVYRLSDADLARGLD